MISRRNFFTMTILMSVIFFLCMFLNNMKDFSNDYKENAFATGTAEDYPSKVNIYVPDGQRKEQKTTDETAGETAGEAPISVSRNRVACIGEEGGMPAKVVREWASYTKRDFAGYQTLASCDHGETGKELLEMLVIDSAYVDWENETETDFLLGCIKGGTHLVFATLPDVSVIRDCRQVRELLGIREVVQEETAVSGIHLYEGFLLGGEMVYQAEEKEERKWQDMELTFPWYQLTSGTKVSMKGISKEEEADPEEDPVVIWRKSFGSAYVFAVNGGYMEGMEGLGILSAMSAEMYSYELYPVVNAQNLVLAGYPGLADENREVMEEYYERPMRHLYQETVWPNVTTDLQDYEIGITCLMTPQYDYTDQNLPDPKLLSEYMKNFHEKSVEIGWSSSNVSGISMSDKLSEDQKFITEAVGGYEFASFYGADMDAEETMDALHAELLSSVRTVVRDYGEDIVSPVGYLSEHITEQRAVVDGPEYSFRRDFRARCVETALGYLNMCCDMKRLVYPRGKKDSWDKLAKEFVRNADVYGKAFQGFDRTTISQSDVRIRNFLTLDYSDSRKENQVHLQIDKVEGTVWFVFRNHGGRIRDVEGGSFVELEEGAYLIEADSKEVTILLEPSDERYYY